MLYHTQVGVLPAFGTERTKHMDKAKEAFLPMKTPILVPIVDIILYFCGEINFIFL